MQFKSDSRNSRLKGKSEKKKNASHFIVRSSAVGPNGSMKKIHVGRQLHVVVFLVPVDEYVPSFLFNSQKIVEIESLLPLHVFKSSAYPRLRSQHIEGSELSLTFL